MYSLSDTPDVLMIVLFDTVKNDTARGGPKLVLQITDAFYTALTWNTRIEVEDVKNVTFDDERYQMVVEATESDTDNTFVVQYSLDPDGRITAEARHHPDAAGVAGIAVLTPSRRRSAG